MEKMFDISKNELFDNAISNKVVFTPLCYFKTIHIVYPNNIDSI